MEARAYLLMSLDLEGVLKLCVEMYVLSHGMFFMGIWDPLCISYHDRLKPLLTVSAWSLFETGET